MKLIRLSGFLWWYDLGVHGFFHWFESESFLDGASELFVLFCIAGGSDYHQVVPYHILHDSIRKPCSYGG